MKNYYLANKKKELKAIKQELATKLTSHHNGAHVYFDYKTGWQIRPVGQALGKELGVQWIN